MNRYTQFALVMISVMIVFMIFNIDDDEKEILGYAENIHQSSNGYVFTIMDENGEETKAFYEDEIDDSLHVFKGKYSDDKEIFFISSID